MYRPFSSFVNPSTQIVNLIARFDTPKYRMLKYFFASKREKGANRLLFEY
jgi:hypothetical protein